jgi:hypothetical protein
VHSQGWVARLGRTTQQWLEGEWKDSLAVLPCGDACGAGVAIREGPSVALWEGAGVALRGVRRRIENNPPRNFRRFGWSDMDVVNFTPLDSVYAGESTADDGGKQGARREWEAAHVPRGEQQTARMFAHRSRTPVRYGVFWS